MLQDLGHVYSKMCPEQDWEDSRDCRSRGRRGGRTDCRFWVGRQLNIILLEETGHE